MYASFECFLNKHKKLVKERNKPNILDILIGVPSLARKNFLNPSYDDT